MTSLARVHRTRSRAALTLLAIGLCCADATAQERPASRDFSNLTPVQVERAEGGVLLLAPGNGGPRSVRLLCVRLDDARCDRDACDGFLTRLLVGEEVYVELPPSDADPSKGGSSAAPPAARVFRSPDGLDVSLELIRQGYAPVGADAPIEERALFRSAETRAKRHARGIWAPAGGAAASAPTVAKPRSTPGPEPHDAELVYVTPSGKKYHRADCQHVGKSGRGLPLREARAKYQPCARCKPPT